MAPISLLSLHSSSTSHAQRQAVYSLLRRVTDSTAGITNLLRKNNLIARQSGATSDPQVGTIIPTTYAQQGTLAPGAVAGIVLGVVFGILLFIIIVAWAMRANSGIEPSVEDRIEVRERGVSPRRRRRKSRRDYDVADVRVVRDVSPRRSSHRSPRHSGTRTQIVEERIVVEPGRSRSRAPSITVMPPPPPVGEVYIERRPSRRRSGVEEVIVMEGSDSSSSSPRRKRKSKRRGSGYRIVEPARYAGGNHERRSVSRRRDN